MTSTSDNLSLFVALITASGLPAPVREYRFTPRRRWRFDLAFPEQMVAFEREGGTWNPTQSRHTRSRGYQRDVEKYNEAAILGWKVIRATSDMMRDGTAFTLLERALKEAGS